jgi:hypothetical protein
VTTIAVIQPYFFPYAGYFRLWAAADLVVMFDCVQFPRRGWVHRNRFTLVGGEQDWLTLPLAKAAFDARIDELRWADDARSRLAAELRRFPDLQRSLDTPLVRNLLDVGSSSVTEYLCLQAQEITEQLGVARPMLRSSSLPIDPKLRGQERVIAIVEHLNGTQYVNPSGGRELYGHDRFAQAGLELRFLTPYEGSTDSILTRLLRDGVEAVADEIRRETILVS